MGARGLILCTGCLGVFRDGCAAIARNGCRASEIGSRTCFLDTRQENFPRQDESNVVCLRYCLLAMWSLTMSLCLKVDSWCG